MNSPTSAAKVLAQKTLQSFGVELRRWPHPKSIEGQLVRVLRAFDIGTVFDVGANVGQYGQLLRSLGYTGRIVSFEPNPASFRQLERTARGDAKWHVEPIALGAEWATMSLYVTRGSDLASLHRPTARATALFGDAAEVAEEVNVTVAPLDDVFRQHVVGREGQGVLLKMDTQGHDAAVLAGARRSLPHIAAVQTEVPVTRLYESMPSMETVLAALGDAGYQHGGLWAVSTDRVSVVEYDYLATRGRP